MICLIGASGFIGTRLAGQLNAQGEDFIILDKCESTTFPDKTTLADIRDSSQLRAAVPAGTAIIHLAAEHRDDVQPRSLYDEVNIEGTRKVCEVAREKNIQQIVFTSSVAVYGFAPANTDESGAIAPFNDYGRTKYEAEQVLREWLREDPDNRSLVIIRPTVVFGEANRGNVYNLLRQIASGKFCMFGNGENRKSMAYVENVAGFLRYSLSFGPGEHLYNYIDKPDFNMNELISHIRKVVFDKEGVGLRLPAPLGMAIGYTADIVAWVTKKALPVSSIRVKKFMGTTQFASSVASTGFIPPVSLEEGLARTLKYEFLEDNSNKQTFETE